MALSSVNKDGQERGIPGSLAVSIHRRAQHSWKGSSVLQQPVLQRKGFRINGAFTKTEGSIIMGNNKFRELSKLFHFPL